MDYYINPSANMEGAFTVPCSAVDRYFRFSKPEHIKVLLYILRNMAVNSDLKVIAEECNLNEYDVKEALLYWADAGLLLPKGDNTAEPKKEKKQAVARQEKPTRGDIARRSLEDAKIQYLLTESQKRFARNLKDNEARTLVWLYDDQGLDVSLILLVLQYASLKDKLNIRFVEKTALELLDKGIDNVADADAELHKQDLGEKAWIAVSSAFGLERRKPSQRELEKSVLWIDDWKIDRETLIKAYDECVNQKSKFSFAYVARIIENWHNGKPAEKKAAKRAEDFASYDLDLYEKMLNSKD